MQYFQDYAPGFDLHLLPSNRVDDNSDESVCKLVSIVKENLQNVSVS